MNITGFLPTIPLALAAALLTARAETTSPPEPKPSDPAAVALRVPEPGRDSAADNKSEPTEKPAKPALDPAEEARLREIELAEKKEREEMAALQKKIGRLNAERDLLMAENNLRAEQLKKELGALNDERERNAARFAAEREKIASELAKQRLEAERLALQSELMSKQLAYEETKLRFETAQATVGEKKKESLLKAQNALSTEELTSSTNALRAKDNEIKLAKMETDAELMRLDAKIRTFDRQEIAGSLAPRERISYLKEPFDGKKLVISDRRIDMNGAILYPTAEQVTERINYYNNVDPELPIFIVIDSNMGGSVMAGIQILKAMESSRAPVYVVVKTFAASMAACICTLAEKSFAYPSAILLHHQISYGMSGNLRQQQEELEQGREWFSRLGGPVAKKMGITTEQFIKSMYEKNSTGDWQEFADKAQQLKWVDHVAQEIVESAQLKNPDIRYPSTALLPGSPSTSSDPSPGTWPEAKLDAQGRTFYALPPLRPFDCYHLYDPRNQFKAE